ncbi:MAG TPA: 16S rRNA (cytosine(967)-C(5))-methyltransferase RsmB [Armatimonadota bacterium]|nr:16S rRNA (cytosine(967)-C(5))-methyltransferase RsmB [Armatimonadota bacterium]HOS44066.1 16S rRNA (cytosine(967)-C(5))-methyltransferase RsmB [Armatimonadota bacterium]
MAIAQSRQLALEVLLRVAGGASATAALEEALSRADLDPRDRGFVTELVDGTLRWQGRLDHQLAQLVEGPLEQLTPAVWHILRLGAYQLTRLERVPAHAAVHDAVEQARARVHDGAAKLVNAVLRRLEREKAALPFPDPTDDPVAHLAATYSHPAWLVERWLARFGPRETEALLAINNTPPPLTLRLNRRWVTREGLQAFLKLREIATIPTAISPNGLIVTSGGNPRQVDLYAEGLYSIQGEGSMVMVELLKPGRRRAGWDMAAGVGGKTTYLAEWVDDSGSLLATDTSADRLRVLRNALERLELSSVRVEAGDARAVPVAPESMDYILLDAPCSGTGALRRQADARWRKAPAQLAEMAILQRELLEAAARAAKPGGLLLYCTCSLEPEENEAVVAPFLADHPAWSLDVEGLTHQTLPADARDPAGYVRLLPQRHGTDGFFAARLKKAGA